tara:strand:+ start:2215 stop:3129 length:915 start_codon:yes stop_codon:yes gene_type:complete
MINDSEFNKKFSLPLVNGEFVNDKTFKQVSVLSPSFQYGLTVFEGIRAYYDSKGIYKPFLLNKHIKRIINSSKLIGIKLDFSISEIEEDIKKIIKISNFSNDIYIKYMIGFLDSGSWFSFSNPDRIGFCYELPSTLRSGKLEFLSASFTSIQRISSDVLSPKIKCGANYINSRMGVLDVNKGFSNSIIPIFIDNNGFISETSGACLFIIKGMDVITPSLTSSVLESITRSYVLEKIAPYIEGYSFKEKFIDRWDVLSSDAVFIVGTNVEIKGINKIDHVEFNKNNKALIDIFHQFRKIIDYKDD